LLHVLLLTLIRWWRRLVWILRLSGRNGQQGGSRESGCGEKVASDTRDVHSYTPNLP
jgi:hypothetical protein